MTRRTIQTRIRIGDEMIRWSRRRGGSRGIICQRAVEIIRTTDVTISSEMIVIRWLKRRTHTTEVG